MPNSPSTMPPHSRVVLRWPNNWLNSRVNSGTVATARAATPEDTPQCSATVTPPLPQLSRRIPTIPAPRHSRQVGSAAGDDEAHPGHQHRWPGLDAEADRQVSGAPDEVQGEERTEKQQRNATGRHGKHSTGQAGERLHFMRSLPAG